MTIKAVNAYWDGSSGVVVVSRDATGRRVQRRERADHCMFMRKKDATPELVTMLRKSSAVLGIRDEKDGHYRVSFRSREMLRRATETPDRPRPDGTRDCYMERWGVKEVFEADVLPVRRWLTDHADELEFQRPRRCYLDLETDSRLPFSKKEEMRILSWAVVSDDNTVRVVRVLREWTLDAERELIEELLALLDQFDQVAAWNLDRFDLPVLKARAAECGIQASWDGWLWVDHLEIFRRMNVTASESGEEKQSYKLEAIAQQVLGEGKDEFDSAHSYEAWERKDPALPKYNLKDSDLLRRIEEKTGYLDLVCTVCEACNTFPDTHGSHGTHFVEGFLLKLARGSGIRFPTKWHIPVAAPFEGAYVMEPTRLGIVRDVHVCDFAALYPSIIQTWNLSPETQTGMRVGKQASAGMMHFDQRYYKGTPRPPGCSEVPDLGWAFRAEPEGFLPKAVTRIRELRAKWNKLKASLPPGTKEWKEADRQATGFKIVANTFYGVVGSPLSRFFVRDVAESVTQAGVWLIKLVIKEAERKGWCAFYCDTDSSFVTGCTESQFREFAEWCNKDLFPRVLAELGCVRNEISLAYEKEFSVLAMVSKKRYAAVFAHYKGTRATADSKPEIKGLEYKRGDTVRIAREMQAEVIGALLKLEGAEACREIVLRRRGEVLEGPLAIEDVRTSKTLTQNIRAYKVRLKKDGTEMQQPAHVEVAKVLAKRGRDVGEGSKVEYYVTDGSVSPQKVAPAEDYNDDVDRHHLWESMVYPATERVLEACFPHQGWREIGKTRPRKQTAKSMTGTLFSEQVLARPKRGAGRKKPAGQSQLPGMG